MRKSVTIGQGLNHFKNRCSVFDRVKKSSIKVQCLCCDLVSYIAFELFIRVLYCFKIFFGSDSFHVELRMLFIYYSPTESGYRITWSLGGHSDHLSTFLTSYMVHKFGTTNVHHQNKWIWWANVNDDTSTIMGNVHVVPHDAIDFPPKHVALETSRRWLTQWREMCM